MLDKPRIRAFAEFIKQYGEQRLMDCLEKNEKNGVVYHYPGSLIGDYDKPQSTEQIFDMILNGKKF